jgi:hypothetical protein
VLQIAKELSETLEFYKNGGAQAMALAPEVVKDLQISSGLQAYNLLPTALTLYPALTPVRNMLPRLQGRAKQSEFKAVVGLSGDSLSTVWGSEGNSGVKVNLQTDDIIAVYRSIKEATGISFEQQWAGQGYIDSKSTAVVNLLRQFMINEELAILYGINSSAASNQFGPGAVGTPAAATIATAALPTGVTAGNLAGATAFLQYSAVTGMGESKCSVEQSVAVSASNALKITLPARAGLPILYYKFYTGTTTGTEKLNTAAATVYVDSLGTGVTAVAAGLAADNSGAYVATGGVVWITTAGTGTASQTATDNSASANAYNGFIAQLYGSSTYAWPSVSTPMSAVGATIISANGQLAVAGSATYALENFLATMWNKAAADPKWAVLFQTEARKITNVTLGQTSTQGPTPYFIVPQGAPSDATANFRVSRIINPVTGSEVVLKTHPYHKQGSIIFGTDELPSWYVPTEIPAPIAIDMLQDYTEIDYPPVYNTSGTGDTWVVQVMNMGTFKLFIPPLFGVLDSIALG